MGCLGTNSVTKWHKFNMHINGIQLDLVSSDTMANWNYILFSMSVLK